MGEGDGVGGERHPRSEVSWGLGRRRDTAIYDEHGQVVIYSIPRDNGTWEYVLKPGYSDTKQFLHKQRRSNSGVGELSWKRAAEKDDELQ